MNVLIRMKAQRAMVAAVLAVVAAAGAVAFPAAPAAPADCAGPRFVAGVGRACAVDGGYLITLDDGTERFTHGPDVFPEQWIHAHGEFASVKPRDPSCISDPRSQYHVQVVYISPSDGRNEYSKMLPVLRRMIGRMNGLLYDEGQEFGRPMAFRMACQRGEVSVLNVPVAIASANADLQTLTLAFRRAGYANPFAKYWMYFDAPSPVPGAGGIATGATVDDRLAANNAANYGPDYAVFYDVNTETYQTMAMMHEGAHLFGAINDSAPNSTLGGHCIDDSDVMCYPDGGAREKQFKPDVCREMHFDCRHDDYFNPAPKKGSYLATHWNLASPLNRFMAGCSYRTGKMTVGTAGQDADAAIGGAVDGWDNVMSASVAIPAACDGRPFALTGVFSPLPRETDALMGLTPDLQQFVHPRSPDGIIGERYQPNFDVCFFKGAKRLKCSAATGAEVGVVPVGATRAKVTFTSGISSVWVLSIV